jgi:hypothetical protein
VTKHARFLHIEQRRADDGSGSETADRARIAAVLDAAPPSHAPPEARLEIAPDSPAGTGAAIEPPEMGTNLEDVAAPGGGVELALDTAPVEGQPFVRCSRCGGDNTIHAKACETCAATLDTAEQRAFNDRVWDAQRRRNEKERAALAEMAQYREELRRNTVRPLPEPGMQPPPELLEPMNESDGPFLVEVIRALQKPKWRLAVAATVVGLPLLFVTLGGPILSKLGWVMAVLLVLSLFPRSIARRLFGALLQMRR